MASRRSGGNARNARSLTSGELSVSAVHARACTGIKNARNSVTVQNRTHVYMNFFHHKDLGNHLLQLCPKVVKHPVYIYTYIYIILRLNLSALSARQHQTFLINSQSVQFILLYAPSHCVTTIPINI